MLGFTLIHFPIGRIIQNVYKNALFLFNFMFDVSQFLVSVSCFVSWLEVPLLIYNFWFNREIHIQISELEIVFMNGKHVFLHSPCIWDNMSIHLPIEFGKVTVNCSGPFSILSRFLNLGWKWCHLCLNFTILFPNSLTTFASGEMCFFYYFYSKLILLLK